MSPSNSHTYFIGYSDIIYWIYTKQPKVFPCVFWSCSLYTCEVAFVSLPCATCGTGGTIGDLLIYQLKIEITVGKQVPGVIPICRIQI